MATSAEFDTLSAAVTANNDVEDSATVLLNGLAPLIAAAAGDKTASLALADMVKTKSAALAAAVAANTTSAP